MVEAQKKNESRPAEIRDRFAPAPHGSVRIGGYLGDRIDLCIANRVMSQDINRVVEPFHARNDQHWGFRCEFWGKWFTSAMLAYGYEPTPQHRDVVNRAIDGLLQSQTADGYIGTYPDEHHLGPWDVWGRKYVLLGLLSFFEQTGDSRAMEAARRVADHLIREAGPESGVNIAATGWIGWKGLAPCSVLEPIVLLYRQTGEQQYLDFAKHIIRSWDTPNRLTPTGIRLIREALSDVPLWEMGGAPKAYEMMSCFEGLCEMYRATGEQIYFDASQRLIDNIIRDEIMIVGSGSIAEIWCNGKMRQSDPIYQGMETCVTVTWMKFLYQMLRLTGNSRYADQLEISLYNALLSAQTPKGDWWSYFTGLMGERTPSHLQFPDVVMSCCVANGPRGLLLTPSWAVMTSAEGPVVNLYGKTDARIRTPRGQELAIHTYSDYPVRESVKITLATGKKETFTLRLRIPAWSERTRITVNGKPYDGYTVPGTYASIRREWSGSETVEITFDMRARVTDAPSGLNDAAIMRGPVVLAFDTRLEPFRFGVETPPMYRYKFQRNEGYTEVELMENAEHPDIWMTFRVPVTDEAGDLHFLKMCDYPSAGNTWQEGNLFRVWTPQPFDFRHLYINKLNWRINNPDSDERPDIPELYRK
jgi:DUF1680 family protein